MIIFLCKEQKEKYLYKMYNPYYKNMFWPSLLKREIFINNSLGVKFRLLGFYENYIVLGRNNGDIDWYSYHQNEWRWIGYGELILEIPDGLISKI